VFHLKHEYNKNFLECDCKVKDKQLQVLSDDKIINPYFTQNPVVFRPTEYYIVYDFDTMEEIISKDDEQNTHIDIEDNNEFIEGGVCIRRV
jgi:glycine betaine/choline ABC-type transport system substrate-binding protein